MSDIRFQTSGAATGLKFYGRSKELERFKRGVEDAHNITISGLTKIGKTSLYKEAQIRFKQEFEDMKVKFFEFVLSGDDDTLFFKRLAEYLEATVTANEWNKDASVANALDYLKQWIARGNCQHRPFIDLCDEIFLKYGYRFYIILDEFDRAARYMLNRVEDIREMFQSESTGIRGCTVTHPDLSKLFPYESGSSFPATMNYPIILSGFSDADMTVAKNLLNARLREANASNITEELWGEIIRHAGNAPYLLNLFFSDLIYLLSPPQSFNIADIKFEQIKNESLSSFTKILDKWFDFFWRYDLQPDVKKAVEDGSVSNDLVLYGIIQDENNYAIFVNKFFKDYLKTKMELPIEIDNDFISRLNIILEMAEPIIKKCTDKLSNVGRGVSSGKASKIMELRKELISINALINCCKDLQSNKSKVAQLILTDTQLNAFTYYINQHRGDLDA